MTLDFKKMSNQKEKEVEYREVEIPKGWRPRYFEIVGDKLEIYFVKDKIKPMKFLV